MALFEDFWTKTKSWMLSFLHDYVQYRYSPSVCVKYLIILSDLLPSVPGLKDTEGNMVLESVSQPMY